MDELLQVTLRSGAWDYQVVTAVVDGVAGRWYVLRSWPKASEGFANRGVGALAVSRGRSGCA